MEKTIIIFNNAAESSKTSDLAGLVRTLDDLAIDELTKINALSFNLTYL